MLGEFSITVKDKTISDQNNHSQKLWNLLSYLITYRNRKLSQTELIHLLWKDGQSSNPNGALKTLMHRLRALLKKLDYPEEFILQKPNSYIWNNSLPCVFDVDVFENYYKEGLYADSKEKRLEKYRKAITTFKGNFLPRMNHETWSAPIYAYYHNIYLKIAAETINMLMEKERYAETANICWQALTIDPYMEDFHYHLIRALYLSGNLDAALKQYSTTTGLFLSKFADTPSEQLKTLYKEITRTTKKVEIGLDIIENDLKKGLQRTEALYCEYEIFKYIYHLKEKISKQTENFIYLCLITITSQTETMLATDTLTFVMKKLQEIISKTLRPSDIYTRYSISQFLLMLPCDSYDTTFIIIKNILNQYDKKVGNQRIKIDYILQSSEAS